MKKILLFLFVISVAGFSQTTEPADRSAVSSDVSECVRQIYDNPAAIKELISALIQNKETLRRVHRELMNDPEMKQMMQDLRREMGNNMHKGMQDDENNYQHNEMDDQKRE